MPDLRDRPGHAVKDYGEGGFAAKIVSRNGAERIARFACQLARKRQARGKPGKITCVTKSNVLPRSDGRFQEMWRGPRVYRDGKILTPDQGGTAHAGEMAGAVLAAYRNA